MFHELDSGHGLDSDHRQTYQLEVRAQKNAAAAAPDRKPGGGQLRERGIILTPGGA